MPTSVFQVDGDLLRVLLRLPEGVEIETYLDSSRMLNDRIDLLTRNGLQGLVLVFISLCLFLRGRVRGRLRGRV